MTGTGAGEVYWNVFKWVWFWSEVQSARWQSTWGLEQDNRMPSIRRGLQSERSKTFAFVDVQQRTDLGRSERNMFLAVHNLQLLASNAVGHRPQVVILMHYIALLNNSLKLREHSPGHKNLLSNHRVVLVIRVVCIPQLSCVNLTRNTIGPELKLEKFMSELSPVPNIIANIKILHCK